MRPDSQDPVFRYLKKHAGTPRGPSPSREQALFARIAELREGIFRRTWVWVPVSLGSLVLVLLVSMSVIQGQRQELLNADAQEMELFLEETFQALEFSSLED